MDRRPGDRPHLCGAGRSSVVVAPALTPWRDRPIGSQARRGTLDVRRVFHVRPQSPRAPTAGPHLPRPSRWARHRSTCCAARAARRRSPKNAKDAYATEALEIATYTALERLAASVGDDTTARLAASIRADEEPMLARLLRDIPKLVEAVVGAELRGEPSYRVADTGAADAVREAATSAKSTARQARKVPGVARAEGQVKGAVTRTAREC
ncbi:MAG TPA: DUF892 family protein [Solirubrobacteraceae bacterium]|nr:DUF892 family protein [Solirubrobacteraceae bacterium]